MVQPYNINIPNPGEQMLAGIQAGQDYMIKYKAQQEQARMQEDLAAFSQKEDKTPEDVQKLIFKYPVLSKQLDQSLQNLTEQQKENRISQLTPIYMALNKGNTDVAKAQVDELIAAYQNSGNEFEAKNLQTLKSNIELDPQGAITSSELLIYKAMGPEALQQYLTASQKAKTETEEGLKGRFQPSTEKGPDGTIWAMNDKGEVTVKDITGKVLEGEEARKAWLKSKEYGVDIANRTTYGKESGRLSAQKGTKAEIEEEVTYAKKGTEAAIKKSEEFGKSADMAGQRIEKLDNAINVAESAIAEGKSLGKGWFQNRVPKISKYRVLMQQAARDLGLGVIQSTTFGALSKGEMDLAMETALPPLGDKDLLDWLKRRRAAEEKIQNELSRAAIFLSQPGNTVGKWRKLQLDIRAGKITPEQAYGEQPTAAPADMTQQMTGKTIVRTGTYKGRKVVQYSDGSMEYAD